MIAIREYLLIASAVFVALALLYSVRGWSKDYFQNEYFKKLGEDHIITIVCYVLALVMFGLWLLSPWLVNDTHWPSTLEQWQSKYEWTFVEATEQQRTTRSSRIARFCNVIPGDEFVDAHAAQLFDEHLTLRVLTFSSSNNKQDDCTQCSINGSGKFTCLFGQLLAQPLHTLPEPAP